MCFSPYPHPFHPPLLWLPAVCDPNTFKLDYYALDCTLCPVNSTQSSNSSSPTSCQCTNEGEAWVSNGVASYCRKCPGKVPLPIQKRDAYKHWPPAQRLNAGVCPSGAIIRKGMCWCDKDYYTKDGGQTCTPVSHGWGAQRRSHRFIRKIDPQCPGGSTRGVDVYTESRCDCGPAAEWWYTYASGQYEDICAPCADGAVATGYSPYRT
jgi:hypothetical protein